MPGGFENSAMKSSFSLSSLQPPPSCPETPEHARLRLERPYNSLTKKPRRDPEQETWRRSWGSHNKDEFWAALQSDYDYLMDNNLIDTCKEANGDLSMDSCGGGSSEPDWSFNQFTAHFLELYSWLNSIQEAVYGKEETVTDRGLRTSHMERMQREGFRRRMFNEQSSRLLELYPDLRDEVSWRVSHLNSKWETLELAMTPSKGASDHRDMCTDVEHEVRCLRKWVREMEGRLQPLDFRAGLHWTFVELEQKAKEYLVLQRDVESHGKIVSSVVKLCERVALLQQQQQLSENSQQQQQEQLQQRSDALPALRKARSLERRWHHLFLRSLEWQCHLETLANKLRQPSREVPTVSDSDEEPVSKQPRLSGAEPVAEQAAELRDGGAEREDCLPALPAGPGSHGPLRDPLRDPAMPCALPCAMPAASIKATKRRRPAGRSRASPPPQPLPAGAMTAPTDPELAPAPAIATTPTSSTVPDVNHNVADDTLRTSSNNINNNNHNNNININPTNKKRSRDDNSRFNRSNRNAPNCATFYFRHLDTDSDRPDHPDNSDNGDHMDHEDDIPQDDKHEELAADPRLLRVDIAGESFSDPGRLHIVKSNEESSDTEDSWTYHARGTNGNGKGHEGAAAIKTSPMRSSKECIQRLVRGAEELVRPVRGAEELVRPDAQQLHKRLAAQGEDLPRADENALVAPAGPPLRAARCFEPLRFDTAAAASNRSAKQTRIKQWLSMHSHDAVDSKRQPPDSCDASGEYTTEDSEEDKASLSSEDMHNCSVATYREVTLGCSSMSGSNEAILDQETPVNERARPMPVPTDASCAKVILRNKRRGQLAGDRPWSVSSLSQLVASSCSEPLSHFSISESALHQLATPATSPAKGAVGGSMVLSSSTMEESMAQTTCAGSSSGTGSLRRRKIRHRKRPTRRSESGSDGVFAMTDCTLPRHQLKLSPLKTSSPLPPSPMSTKGLVKSGSFSGTPAIRRLPSTERLTNSDPSAMPHRKCKAVNGTAPARAASMSSTETDEEEASAAAQGRLLPVFRLGPEAGVLNAASRGVRRDGSDFEKLSIHSTEQASWDSYQEKYLSEPYSEDPPDPEAARRLLEFGDDYRNFMDSQSDCASSLSTNPNTGSPLHRRRIRPLNGAAVEEDSDSDLEELRQVMRQSEEQLCRHELMFSEQLANAPPNIILGTDYSDILSTCRENVRCLNDILNNEEVRSGIAAVVCRDIRGLTDRWASLQDRAEDLHRVRSLQREMLLLKDELLALAARVAAAVEMDRQVDDMQQLQDRINSVKADLESLRNRKPSILQLNVDVHRYTTDCRQQHPAAVLKGEIADLYRVWDDTYQGVTEQLDTLQRIADTWQQFEKHFAELQSALFSDRQTLQLLEGYLQGGRPPAAVVGCVRDVARALSEGQTTNTIGQSALDVLAEVQTAALCHTEGGSLSDSGISDTGSDQEPSEREKRLANLRRLVRQLEAVLSPGSRALENMTERIRETENKLRGLQKTCRNLIVRTAVREAVTLSPSSPQDPAVPADPAAAVTARSVVTPAPTRRAANGIRSKRGASRRRRDPDGDPDDPDSGKALSRHWLWRVVRASLPCHLGIVLILCVACLLEPHCCDAINNLNLSLSPQLRYIRGPPPV